MLNIYSCTVWWVHRSYVVSLCRKNVEVMLYIYSWTARFIVGFVYSRGLTRCLSPFNLEFYKENSLSMFIMPYLSFYLRLYIVYFYIDINIYCILYIAYRVNKLYCKPSPTRFIKLTEVFQFYWPWVNLYVDNARNSSLSFSLNITIDKPYWVSVSPYHYYLRLHLSLLIVVFVSLAATAFALR